MSDLVCSQRLSASEPSGSIDLCDSRARAEPEANTPSMRERTCSATPPSHDHSMYDGSDTGMLPGASQIIFRTINPAGPAARLLASRADEIARSAGRTLIDALVNPTAQPCCRSRYSVTARPAPSAGSIILPLGKPYS